MGAIHGVGTPKWPTCSLITLVSCKPLRSGEDGCVSHEHSDADKRCLIWRQIGVIVEAGWGQTGKWTKAHTTKAHKAKMAAENKQIALVNAVADILVHRNMR